MHIRYLTLVAEKNRCFIHLMIKKSFKKSNNSCVTKLKQTFNDHVNWNSHCPSLSTDTH